MSEGIKIRRVVSIAGVVRALRAIDPIDHATWREGRIPEALVEITAGPPAFETMVATLAANPGWDRQRQRIDRVWSQADGVFYFLDLPPGDYRLRLSAPSWGSRYGSAESDPITVLPAPVGERVQMRWVEVALPVTSVQGIVTHAETGDPIPGVSVRLRGDATGVRTREDGSYELLRLVQGRPLVEASAPQFRIATRRVELAPGQARTVNFRLVPRQT
jgi:hypothetical protein